MHIIALRLSSTAAHVAVAIGCIVLLTTSSALAQTAGQPQADGVGGTKLYPGDYIAFCAPAAAGGCTCSTESQEQTQSFQEFSASIHDYVQISGDRGYLQMLDRLRQQCAQSMQTTSPR